MDTDTNRAGDASSSEPAQSADPGSALLLGSASYLVPPGEDVTLSPAPPTDCPQSAETNAPPPAASPASSEPAVHTWVTSQLQTPPPAACQSQLIIVERRAQVLPGEHMVIVTSQSEGREVLVIPSNQLSASQLAVISSSPAGAVVNIPVTAVTDSSGSSRPLGERTANISLDLSPPVKPLPHSAPNWALRLRNAQKLGDSYRGFCCSESELEAVLLLHKQQTGHVFGTRQSPSVDKPASRLMWKSQYVPYDGIPFVNAGSRAVVMECQFGPRRKGLQPNKSCEASYKATCPARIYIKKVRKFPEFRVPTEPMADRRTVRQEQEKAFQSLKNQNLESRGVVRFYLQLPTERAHLYHREDTPPIPPPPPDLPPPLTQPEEEEVEMEEADEQDGAIPSRLHPRVAQRIRQLVATGHHQVYSIRKQLRHFVEKELFGCDGPPERHDLRYFPTVNDIKNHIHESQKALGLNTGPSEWSEESSEPLMDTVTLTLTPAAEAVDGCDSLSPEAAQLFTSLSSFQPKIFAQLQGTLQPPPPPPLSPLPLPSFLQTPAEEPVEASSPEEVPDGGQQFCGGTQQVLQKGENIHVHIVNSAADGEDGNQSCFR